MEQIVNTRAQILFMITESASGSCNVDVSTNIFESLRSLSQLSRGLLIQTSLMQLSDATFSVAQDLWQYDTILTNDLEDCRKAPMFQPFFVDQSIDFLTLRASGCKLFLCLSNIFWVPKLLSYKWTNLMAEPERCRTKFTTSCLPFYFSHNIYQTMDDFSKSLPNTNVA